MATTLQDLCRLCAKKHEFSKDLSDEKNKNVLDLIRQYTQISVNESDNLPTKVCLDCEEKMVSFQLFILECYKIQDALRNMYLERCAIKLEDDICDFGGVSLIKSEVKDELTAEDIVDALSNEAHLEEYENDDDFQADDGDYDDMDNVAIASLKVLNKKVERKKEMTEEQTIKFKELLKRPNLKMKDFIKMSCSICDSPFKTWTAMYVHYIKTHKSKPIVFCICGFLIRSKSVLYKHITKHKQENRKVIRSQIKLAAGSDYNVKDYINFVCTSCEKQCSSWYTLKSHCERVHKIPPVVQCRCGVTIKSKSVMYKHVNDHKNPNELSCDQCSLITKSLAALNKHKMKHVPKSDRKFCCVACNKIFNNKDALKSHEKSHVPIEARKIYHCDMCDMKFTTRSSATSHKRVVHEKIKSYVCDLCGYACGTNGELRQHRAIHSDDKPFVCNTCSKPFKTYSNLKTHMDTHEQTSYTCYVCSRVLNSRRTLRKHLLVHEDKCRHVCSYCNKAFKRRQTLKVHMYTHTGDKPLSCKWCDERFSYASTLRSHRLRCHPDKMAAQAHPAYHTYSHVVAAVQDNYIKNDLAAAAVTKNEVEAM